jgi:hypothetical protein
VKAAWATTAALVACVLVPLTCERRWDDYPFSSYPMFSRGDLGRVVSVSHAVLVDGGGKRAPASPSLVGTPEPMVAKALVEGAIRRSAAGDLCAQIATRARDEAPSAIAVEIVTSHFDSRRYFEGEEGRTPLHRDIHATCKVQR